MSKTLKKVSRKEPAFVFNRKGKKRESTIEKLDFLLELNRLQETLLIQVKKEIR